MIPHTSKAIAFLAQRLFTHVLPEQRSTFGMADVALLGLLFEMVGQDFDRAAQARLEDIREMRELFAQARGLGLEVDPGPEALDLSDVRISRLDEIHALHGRALIELHARIEQIGDAELDRRVWQYLERHAERHRYDVNF